MKAEFGWTVIRNNSRTSKCAFLVYKRDSPANKENNAADLAPFTHPTQTAAVNAGKAGDYAGKR